MINRNSPYINYFNFIDACSEGCTFMASLSCLPFCILLSIKKKCNNLNLLNDLIELSTTPTVRIQWFEEEDRTNTIKLTLLYMTRNLRKSTSITYCTSNHRPLSKSNMTKYEIQISAFSTLIKKTFPIQSRKSLTLSCLWVDIPPRLKVFNLKFPMMWDQILLKTQKKGLHDTVLYGK